MDKAFALLVLLANLLVLKCQEEDLLEDNGEYPTSTGNPNYSFSYGVSDVHTGDMKTVWEEKDGDTVKGHYSVLEPDGTMRSVEYSASPETGFTAVVNNDWEKIEQERVGKSYMEDKVQRDYGKFYDFSEDADIDSYMSTERKKNKHSFDSFKDYASRKKPKYPNDLDTSDFSHSISITHPREDYGSAEAHSHSHFGLDIDPNCKHKNKKEGFNNLYGNVPEFDLMKSQESKYPLFTPHTYRDNFEKYESSNLDYERLVSPYGSKLPKPEPDYEKYNPYNTGSKTPKYEDYNFRPSKYRNPYVPDIPSPDFYSEDLPPRPKKKYRPHKSPEFQYPSDDLDDYMLVPKKKKKTPPRVVEPEYLPESDEEYDRPRYPSDFEDDDRPPRAPAPEKKVVRKIIKKRRPGFNLLDILDI